MPNIKKLRVSFDLDASVLMRVLAENNIGFNIEAYETAVEPKRQVRDVEPLLLEDRSDLTLRELVLQRLRHTGRPTKLADLRLLAEGNGHTSKALSNVVYILCQKRMVMRSGKALYRISKRHL